MLFLYLNKMKISLAVLVFVMGLSSLSLGQTILTNRSKSSAKTWLKGDFRKYKYNLTETDTTLMLTTIDSTISKVVVTCSFVKDNCLSEKIAFDCDTCYRITFNRMLDKKRFEWKEIAPGRYISKASRKLLLVGHSAERYLTLSMLTISDDEYKKLLGK